MLAKKIIHRITSFPFHSPWLIIIIFAVLGFIGILNHSMWRDELNPWLIVRDSENFQDLIANIRYEAHPVLWYFSLAIVRQIADTLVAMQIFHLSIAIAAITIFWFYSPFNYKEKFLFTFGFLPFYEYFIICRNYVFSLLFIFAFCKLFASRKKTYLYLAILLGLLANSSIYAFFVSFSLALTLLVELCFDSEHRKEYFSQTKKYDLFLSIAIIIFSFILTIYIIIPPLDSTLHGGLNNDWIIQLDIRNFLRSIGRLFASYFLIVPHKRWVDLSICAFIALSIVAVTLIKLSKKPFSLFFYIIGNSVILAFTYLRFPGSPRHFGHLYLVWIAALWLANYYQDSTFLIDKFYIKLNLLKFGQKWHHVAFMLILYVQFLAGIFCFSRDLVIPFSASRETANYIQKNHIENEFIVASRDANMAALSGYLNRKFYYPELQRMGSFTIFKKGRIQIKKAEIFKQISLLLKSQKEKNRILLILHRQLELNQNDLKITPIKNFERSWVDSERFYLYWVDERGDGEIGSKGAGEQGSRGSRER